MSDPTSPTTRHWRRQVGDAVIERKRGRITRRVVASACGRLVDLRQAVGDPSEADCSECMRILALLNTFGGPNP